MRIASSQLEDEGGDGEGGVGGRGVLGGHLAQVSSTSFSVQSTEELLKGQLRNGFSVEVESHRLLRRAATARLERLWDFGVIPYDIESNFSGTFVSTLHSA